MRLIDANRSRDTILDAGFWEAEDKEIAVYCIDATPTIDAVEVVRCRDCIYSKDGYCTTVDMINTYSLLCTLDEAYHEHNWFCADGVRRDDGSV